MRNQSGILKMMAILLVSLFCLANTIHAQDYLPITNVWQKDGVNDYKMHIENARVDAGPAPSNWASAYWAIEPVPGRPEYRIRNRWKKDGETDYYLHNQNGRIEAGAIELRWHSASWIFHNIPGTDTYRIQNFWKQDEYLHIQGNQLEVGPIQPNWASAIWKIEGFKSKSPTVAAPKPTTTAARPTTPKPTTIASKPSLVNQEFQWIENLDNKSGKSIEVFGDPDSWMTNVAKNWMGKLPNATKMSRISIPGTHDSSSNWPLPIQQCQNWTILEQLNAGIRYFDFRLAKRGDKFQMVHGNYDNRITFDEVMDQVVEFLDANPTEAILFRRMEQGIDKWSSSYTFDKIYSGYVNRYSDYLLPNQVNENTTLGQLRGKIAWGNPEIMEVQDFCNVGTLLANTVGGKFISFEAKKIKIQDAFAQAHRSNSGFHLNHISAAGGLMPQGISAKLNPFVYKTLGKDASKKYLGIVSMDFPGEKLIYRIISSNFDQTKAARQRNASLIVTIDKVEVIDADEFSGDDVYLALKYGEIELETDEISNMDDGDSWNRSSSTEWPVLKHYIYTSETINISVRENDNTANDAVIGTITITPGTSRGAKVSPVLSGDGGQLKVYYTVY